MTELSYETFFAALAGNRRLEILQFLLSNGKQSVTSIAEGTGIEQSAVSHNLSQLLACEFVHVEVDGKNRLYTINKETIVPMLKLVERHISKYCSGTCQFCCKASDKQPEKQTAEASAA